MEKERLEKIKKEFIVEGLDDYVGLWQIPHTIRHELGIEDSREVLDLTRGNGHPSIRDKKSRKEVSDARANTTVSSGVQGGGGQAVPLLREVLLGGGS